VGVSRLRVNMRIQNELRLILSDMDGFDKSFGNAAFRNVE